VCKNKHLRFYFGIALMLNYIEVFNMNLSQLFHNCAYTVEYQTAGEDVNYAFVEDNTTLYIYFQGSSSVTD
jgi:hypothetical protein